MRIELNRGELIKQIAETFPFAPIPSQGQMMRKTYLDEEGEEVALWLSGHDWRGITPEGVFNHRFALADLSEDGLVYYLPGFMTACLQDQERVDTMSTTIFHYLTKLKPQRFSREARSLIFQWIEHLRNDAVESDYVTASARFADVSAAFTQRSV